MEVIYSKKALDDIKYWKKSGNKTAQLRIQKLILEVEKTPFKGSGNPEALRYELVGKWSRRITPKDRLVYSLENNQIHIHSLKGHYD